MRSETRMNRPAQFWQDFRKQVYKTSKPLPLTQERECSLAFYAGMAAAFAEVAQISYTSLDDDTGADALEVFRKEIDTAAAKANLDRSDGKS